MHHAPECFTSDMTRVMGDNDDYHKTQETRKKKKQKKQKREKEQRKRKRERMESVHDVPFVHNKTVHAVPVDTNPHGARSVKEERDTHTGERGEEEKKKKRTSKYLRRLPELERIEVDMLGSVDTSCVRRRGARGRGEYLIQSSLAAVSHQDKFTDTDQPVADDNVMHVMKQGDGGLPTVVIPGIADDGICEIAGVLHQKLVQEYHAPINAISVMGGSSTLMCKHAFYMQAMLTHIRPGMLTSRNNRPSSVFVSALDAIKRVYPADGPPSDQPRLSKTGAKLLDQIMEILCAGNDDNARMLVRLMSRCDAKDYGYYQRIEQEAKDERAAKIRRNRDMAKLMPVE